uniref:Uncharacterized protein n=1 Tax=Arundo donax TaxID=35708 RepID=A0A0A9HRF6_ARUDO
MKFCISFPHVVGQMMYCFRWPLATTTHLLIDFFKWLIACLGNQQRLGRRWWRPIWQRLRRWRHLQQSWWGQRPLGRSLRRLLG